MTRFLSLPPLALAAALLAACGGGLQVRTSYDPAAPDLAPLYRTYAWLEPPADGAPRPEAQYADEIRLLLDQAMGTKGYRLTDSAPDFRVGWHLTGTEPVEAATINMYYGYTWGRWFPGGGVVFDGGYRAEVPPRSLIVDVVDGNARELVWRGEVRLDANQLADSTRRQVQFQQALARMLVEFPPKTKD